MMMNRFIKVSLVFLLLVMQFMVSFGQKKVSNCDPTCTKIYDVIVVGGGPAGIGAALVAAELGAKTILVERDYRVGGTTVQASCMGMGQAAGAVAALSAFRQCDPREVPLDLVRKRLTDIGHIVPTK